MDFERSPGIACLCLSAVFILLVSPCQAATVQVHLTSGEAPLVSGIPVVLVNGSHASYLGNDTYVADAYAGQNSTVNVTASYNGYSVNGTTTLCDGQADVSLDMPLEDVAYAVTGTVYADMAGDHRPWPDGRIAVRVDDVPAIVNGSTYSAVLYAPGDGDPLDVKLVHDCGYVLGNASGRVGLSENSTCIDVEAPALEISGDVYAEGVPADGASLFVYVNDRPYGPVMATSGQGPMFSLDIPGGHPGDHVSITASKGRFSGIVSQDVAGYHVFLTVNLKNMDTYIPYSDANMPGSALDEKE